MASFSVSRGRAPRSTIGMYGERKTIARCSYTPRSTVETFGERFSAETCSGKEIAGLRKKIWHENLEIAYERILALPTGCR